MLGKIYSTSTERSLGLIIYLKYLYLNLNFYRNNGKGSIKEREMPSIDLLRNTYEN
jgi:hypothetical protein